LILSLHFLARYRIVRPLPRVRGGTDWRIEKAGFS
jgi:hypothetical protein